MPESVLLLPSALLTTPKEIWQDLASQHHNANVIRLTGFCKMLLTNEESGHRICPSSGSQAGKHELGFIQGRWM